MKELIVIFLKLGALGFGGPVAFIGMMEEECVRKRKWLSIEEYQKLISVSKIFPGPLATLVAVRIGKIRNGNWGGIIAGICVISPAFLLIFSLSALMSSLEKFAFLNSFIVGLTLAAISISIFAVASLNKPLFKPGALHRWPTIIILTVTSLLTFRFPTQEIFFILGFATLGLLLNLIKDRYYCSREAASPILLLALFKTCFKASIFTFGTGIAIVPVLRTAFIDEHHWITNHEFLKGLTLGQITPGPLVIVSTYFGLVAAGTLGAIVCTLGTFVPTFILGLWVIPKVEKTILNSEKLKHFFLWLIPAVCGAILGSLGRLTLYSIVIHDQWLWNRLILVFALAGIMVLFKTHALKILLIGGFAAYFIT